MFTTSLAAGATVIAAAFTAATFERYLWRRRNQDKALAISLAVFTLGAGALLWGSRVGWTSASFRAFYAFGAIINVPFLAAGQMYFMAKKRTADRFLTGAILFGAFSFGITIASPMTGRIDPAILPEGSEVFGVLPRVLAAVGSGLSAVIIFAGTTLSIARLIRARVAKVPVPNWGTRVAGLALIALGTVTLSLSGLLNSVFGKMGAFAVTLTLGISMLFLGYMMSSAPTYRAVPGLNAPNQAKT